MSRRKTGVYVLHNPEIDKLYVGSTNSLSSRKSAHFRMLKDNNHYNYKLQEAYNESPNFEFVSVQMRTRDEAYQFEQCILDEFQGVPELLNIASDARAAMHNVTQETIEKLRQYRLGKPLSMETRQKLSEIRKNRTLDDEHRANVSKALIGHEVTEETKQKLREKAKERFLDPEFLAKHKEACKNRIMSDEAKERLKQVGLQYRNSEEGKNFHSQGGLATAEKLRKPVNAGGIIYPSITDAAKALNTGRDVIKKRIKNDSPKFANWSFVES